MSSADEGEKPAAAPIYVVEEPVYAITYKRVARPPLPENWPHCHVNCARDYPCMDCWAVDHPEWGGWTPVVRVSLHGCKFTDAPRDHSAVDVERAKMGELVARAAADGEDLMRTPAEIESDMRMVCAGEYFRVGVTSATLDGDFSAEQLQRLAALMIEYREFGG